VLFTGSSNLTIDAKSRLAIPAKYRGQWDPVRDGAAWYCLPWPTGHLRLYTEGRFHAMAQRGNDSLTLNEDEARLESDLFGFAERIEPDSAGRILLPKQLMDFVKLAPERDVTIVGARSRLEVHDRGAWEASAAARFAALPDLIARLDKSRPQNLNPGTDAGSSR
jgi:MraZ protein